MRNCGIRICLHFEWKYILKILCWIQIQLIDIINKELIPFPILILSLWFYKIKDRFIRIDKTPFTQMNLKNNSTIYMACYHSTIVYHSSRSFISKEWKINKEKKNEFNSFPSFIWSRSDDSHPGPEIASWSDKRAIKRKYSVHRFVS